MTATPEELLYTPSHEWLRDNGDGTVTMGITDHAQDQLGDVVFVELPEEEQTIAKGEELAVVESVKSASDIYAPSAAPLKAPTKRWKTRQRLSTSTATAMAGWSRSSLRTRTSSPSCCPPIGTSRWSPTKPES